MVRMNWLEDYTFCACFSFIGEHLEETHPDTRGKMQTLHRKATQSGIEPGDLLAVRLGQMRGGGRWRGEVGSGQGCSGDVLRGEEARLPLWTKFAAVWRWCNDSHISFLVNETWEYNSYRPQICFANGGFKWHTTSLQFSSVQFKNIQQKYCCYSMYFYSYVLCNDSSWE